MVPLTTAQEGAPVMGLKEFLTVLVNPVRKVGYTTGDYFILTACGDRVLNKIAVNNGMMPLPKGRANDPSEWWMIARRE